MSIKIVSLSAAPDSIVQHIGWHLFKEWAADFTTFLDLRSPYAVGAWYKQELSGCPLDRKVNGCRLFGRSRWLQRLPIAFVAVRCHDGQFVGTASLDIHDMKLACEGCRGPWLANVFVTPCYRQSGVGSTLVKHVLDYARNALKAPCLHLWTFDSRLETFYTRLGFRRVKSSLKHGEHEDIRVMTIDLQGPGSQIFLRSSWNCSLRQDRSGRSLVRLCTMTCQPECRTLSCAA